MNILVGSNLSINLTKLSNLDNDDRQLLLMDLQARLRRSPTGMLTGSTDSNNDRILTFTESNLLKRIYEIGMETLGYKFIRIQNIDQRDIRILINTAEALEYRKGHTLLPLVKVLKNEILSKAPDNDQTLLYSQTLDSYQDLRNFYIDLALTQVDEDKYGIVAKQRGEGICLAVVPIEECTSDLKNESKRLISQLMKKYNPPLHTPLEGTLKWLIETFYSSFGRDPVLADMGSILSLKNSISSSFNEMQTLLNDNAYFTQLAKMFGIDNQLPEEKILKDRGLITLLSYCNTRYTQSNVFARPFLSTILKFHERNILDKVGYPDEKMSRKDLSRRLKTLDTDLLELNQHVWKKLVAQAALWEALEKIDKAKKYPFEELFRFFIDGSQEPNGDFIFESEPGYITACFNALTLALNNRSEDWNLDWHEKIHDETVIDVFVLNDLYDPSAGYHALERGVRVSKDLKDGRNFSVETLDCDHFGVEDLKARGANNLELTDKPFAYINNFGSHFIAVRHLKPLSEFRSELNELFDTMRLAVKEEKNPISRLMRYAWLARELELRHIYTDANGRTSIIVIYALAAQDPDLPMLCFHDPNVLDMNGPEKLCYRLLESMMKFANAGQLVLPNDKELFTVDSFPADDNLQRMKDFAIEHFKHNERKHWAYYHQP